MEMSAFYGRHDEAPSLRTIQHAVDIGVNLLDTADMYGPWTNERLAQGRMSTFSASPAAMAR